MKRLVTSLAALGLVFVLIGGAAGAAEITKEFRFDRAELTVVNMIGRVDVVPARGDAFEITVHVRGADATEDFLSFVEKEDGGVFVVRFPLDEHDDYVYPELGSGNKSTMRFRADNDHGNSWLRELFSDMAGQKVTVRGSGRGKEVWADMTIAVPADAGLNVRHGLGRIEAADLKADLVLDVNAGSVSVGDANGDVTVDTGSGHVDVTKVAGDLNVDTGSGHVELSDCTGGEIKIDTGSGHVTAADVTCDRLHVDTGSGHVKVRQARVEGALIDTGSGSALLELDRMGGGEYVIDTGSGGIELVLPDGASARIEADTGSGTVACDVDDAEILHKERDEMTLILGDGDAKVRLDAGSGNIHIGTR